MHLQQQQANNKLDAKGASSQIPDIATKLTEQGNSTTEPYEKQTAKSKAIRSKSK